MSWLQQVPAIVLIPAAFFLMAGSYSLWEKIRDRHAEPHVTRDEDLGGVAHEHDDDASWMGM